MDGRVSQMSLTCGGDNLGKMAKNCMKITKSTFVGQNSGGGTWEVQANFSVSGYKPIFWSPPVLPTRGNPGWLAVVDVHIKADSMAAVSSS